MVEAKVSLNEQRMEAVLGVLARAGARSVVDLGCGEGKLLELLRRSSGVEKALGVDAAGMTADMATGQNLWPGYL